MLQEEKGNFFRKRRFPEWNGRKKRRKRKSALREGEETGISVERAFHAPLKNWIQCLLFRFPDFIADLYRLSPISRIRSDLRARGKGGAKLDHKFVIFDFGKWRLSAKSETYSFSNIFSFFLEKYAKPLLRVRHSPSSSPPQVKVWAVLVVAGSYETTSFWQI